MRIPFHQIDAFAERPFTGNPAAVMILEAPLDDATCQSIAAENNIAETAFLIRRDDGVADYDLRWFTPTVEVDLCGHATLASGHWALMRDRSRASVTFSTRQAGVLTVARDGAALTLDLPAWGAEPGEPRPDIEAALGVSPVTTLWRDNGYSVLVLDHEDAVRALTPNFAALRQITDTLVIATAPGSDTDVVSRVFAASAGIDEDPVTGSAHCVIAGYWADRLGRNSFTAYQASTRGGHVACRLDGNRVILGGTCVEVIEGTFIL
nr:PhzF family phenazine biosynthesis protein [Polymorphobacter sp.]